MPYFVYKMSSPEGMDLVKNLELIDDFESFKRAKKFAREQREQLDDGDEHTIIKVMFADNQLLAEEQLMEHREKPIVMEHEK